MYKDLRAALALAVLASACGVAHGGPSNGSAAFFAGAYGAACDGTTDDTAAIQKALDAAGAAGGTVSFPQGTCMIGAVYIGSGTTVQIDAGVTLKAIQAETWWDVTTTLASGATTGLAPGGAAHYPQVFTRVQGIDMVWTSAIVNVRNASNVVIKGGGAIDGNGQLWWTHYYATGKPNHSAEGVGWALNYDEQRPRALELLNATDVHVSGVTLKNSPFWTLHICYSDRVTVDGVTVFNWPTPETGVMPSTDGIDIDSSTNVEVMNSDITANDDALVIKSGRDGEGLRVNRTSAFIKIHDTVVRAGAAAFTIGSETSGGAHDVEVYNIHVVPATALIDSNIGFKKGGPAVVHGFVFKTSTTRGGVMENIHIHDIVIDDAYFFMECSGSWNAHNTIPSSFASTYLEPGYWPAIMEEPSPVEAGYAIYRNFFFDNITMAHVETSVFDVQGSTLPNQAEKGRYTNFTFNNVHITATANSSGASVPGGSISNSGYWAFTNSTIVNGTGDAVVPSLDPNTTNDMTGLSGW
ncbi:putative polygalacturonase [Diplonema papillatum]|nr:putative polygalacturonase [Diplonema papillatum]